MDPDGAPITSRLEEMQQRLHEVWTEAVEGSAPGFIAAPPALAAIGAAVEDLHVAAEEVAASAGRLDAERLRYQHMFELAPNGYLVTDSASRIVEANRAAGELLRADPPSLLGRDVASFIAPSQRSLIAEMTQTSRESGQVVTADDVSLTDELASRRVSLRCGATQDPDGRETGHRWVMHDLTDRFRADDLAREAGDRESAQLRDRAEHWQQLDTAKSQFLHLASHELRSPLTILGGYLAMLEAGTFGHLDAAVGPVIALLSAKTREMNALVTDLLEAARLEDGSVGLARTGVDLAQITAQVVEEWRPLVRVGQRLEMGDGAATLHVEADPQRVRTILVNLISNAIKYSPELSTIVCTVRAAWGTARVAVRDHGIGISPADHAVLFTRFGRVVTPSTSDIPGTGLGLYIARGLARMHGGDITVELSTGSGQHIHAAPAARPRTRRFRLSRPRSARRGAAPSRRVGAGTSPPAGRG